MKTNELTGAALDWAVSKADNPPGKEGSMAWWERDAKGYLFDPLNECTYSPSTDWLIGGSIVEREGIELRGKAPNCYASYPHHPTYHGPTTLVAAMRCFVTSKLGDEVEVPDELVQL
jgi:hypothetical protein